MTYYRNNELYHFGVKGMKWGVRRYENADGTLTAKGKMRYARKEYKQAKNAYGKAYGKAHDYSSRHFITQYTKAKRKAKSNELWGDAHDKAKSANEARDKYKQAKKDYKNSDEYAAKVAKAKKYAKVGAAVAGTALAAYGTYKVGKAIKDKNFQIARENGEKAAKAHLDRYQRTYNSYAGKTINGELVSNYSTKTGHIGQTVYKKGVTAAQARKYDQDYNEAVYRKSREIVKKHTNKAKNDSMINATKNVYNYYKKKRKK